MKTCRFICLCLTIAFVSCLNAQVVENGSSKISVTHLHEDLAFMYANLAQIHAGLYNYTPKKQMEEKFDEIKASIASPLSSIEFYRKIAVLHRYIKNGHTIIIPSKSFDQATASSTCLLPLDVYWHNHQVFVLRNNSQNDELSPGTRIDSINGQSATELFLAMSDMWTRDGENKTFPEGITQRAFAGFYINFIGTPSTYQLVVKSTKGHYSKLNLGALPADIISENRLAKYGQIHHYWQEGDGEALTLDINQGVAHLRIKTCSTSDIRSFGRSVKKTMNNIFERIHEKEVKNLIIDIRNNGGGDDIVARELLRHISPQPFRQFEDSYLITRKIPNKYHYSENIGFLNLMATVGISQSRDHFFRLNSLGKLFFRAGSMLREHKPIDKPFKGQVYALINGYSFSAAGEMAALLKEYTNSIFIGEEPGGNVKNIVAGEVVTLTLPHSQNRIIIPLVHSVVAANVHPVSRGVLPDYRVRNTIKEELDGKDAVMAFTIDLISNTIK